MYLPHHSPSLSHVPLWTCSFAEPAVAISTVPTHFVCPLLHKACPHVLKSLHCARRDSPLRIHSLHHLVIYCTCIYFVHMLVSSAVFIHNLSYTHTQTADRVAGNIDHFKCGLVVVHILPAVNRVRVNDEAIHMKVVAIGFVIDRSRRVAFNSRCLSCSLS